MNNKFYYKDGTISNGEGVHPRYFQIPTSKLLILQQVYPNSSQLLHRLDGPAVEYAAGTKEWYVDGELHRVDGPAIEYSSGDHYWYVDGLEYSEEDFNQLIKEAKALPLALRLIDPREWVRKII